MKRRCHVDTNVLVRFVVGAPVDHYVRAKQLFDAADAGRIELLVEPLVVAEALYVLTSFYSIPRIRTAEVLLNALGVDGVALVDREATERALMLYAQHRVDFADAYLAARAEQTGQAVATFDRDFRRFEGITSFDWATLEN